MELTAGQIWQILTRVDRASKALGRYLSDGELSDLLLDNFDWIPSSVESHAIIDQLGISGMVQKY